MKSDFISLKIKKLSNNHGKCKNVIFLHPKQASFLAEVSDFIDGVCVIQRAGGLQIINF